MNRPYELCNILISDVHTILNSAALLNIVYYDIYIYICIGRKSYQSTTL